ncbi:MAG: cupredoxin domain-containing protein [Candidatus Dormibacteraeota bacterium]|nr:cupredoxin domain-containing protein [Candidatus Dormibacteraeota bacterium]
MTIEATTMAGAAGARAETRFAERTTAMWLVPAAAFIEALIFLRTILAGKVIPPLIVFGVLLAVVTVLVLVHHRPWTDLAGGIIIGLTTAFNAPFLLDGIAKPVATAHQLDEALSLIVGVVGAIAGVVAFIEWRRSDRVRAFRAPLGEALALVVVGVLVGMSYTYIAAFAEVQSSPGAGIANGVTAAPSQAPVELTASGSNFAQKALALKTGGGTVYVVNKDAAEHTFDIDLQGKHYSYPIPAKSTVAVVLNLSSTGTYTYYCAISGHRASGMEGKLTAS